MDEAMSHVKKACHTEDGSCVNYRVIQGVSYRGWLMHTYNIAHV